MTLATRRGVWSAARVVAALVLMAFLAAAVFYPLLGRRYFNFPVAVVLDAHERPVSGAVVRFRDAATGRVVMRRAGADGRFSWWGLREVRGYPSSRYAPRYEPENYVLTRVYHNSKGPSRLFLSAAGTYAVRVVDRGGKPVSGLRLYAAHVATPRIENFATTDARGRIFLPGMPVALRDTAIVLGPEDHIRWKVTDRKRTTPSADAVEYRLTVAPSSVAKAR